MIDRTSLQHATFIGTVLQVTMVAAGHFVAWIAMNAFALGGMGISALAGFLYARNGGGYAGAALGGALAGSICAAIGIAVSVALGDTAPNILLLGTVSSAVTGALGGVVGKLVSGKAAAARS